MAAARLLIVNNHGSLSELPEATVMRLDDRFSDGELIYALESLRSDNAARKRLSRAAGYYLRAVHDPGLTGLAYRDAIEEAHRSPASERSSPCPTSGRIGPPALTQAMAEAAASCAMRSQPAPLEKR